MRRAAVIAFVLAACSKEEPAKQRAPEAGPPPVAADAGYAPAGDKPANARRPRPPEIESGALAVGAKAPAIDLPATGQARWRLDDALSREERVVVVFYRGDW
jgi:hypothetical protein